MKKKSTIPVTRVKNPEPNIKDDNWIIWAAWADRITFEEIKEKTGKTESEVIKIMRRNLKPSSFRLWRKRVHNKSIKNRKKFKEERKNIRKKIRISDIN
ncbi:MAG: TIGR03643 family protein [Pelagibacteraceae bacterium]